MKPTMLAALACTSLLLLTGCAGPGEDSPEPEAPTVEPATTPSETPEPDQPRDESERGNLIKEVGETFGLGSPDSGEPPVTFSVTAIEVDPECTNEWAEPSEYGHFVKIDLEGETTSELADIGGGLWWGSVAWDVIAENGTTMNGSPATSAAWSCLPDSDTLPQEIGPAERVSGSIVLDVPTPSGIVILTDNPDAAWEWEYPEE